MPPSSDRSSDTRRTATVTTSAPEASMASIISSLLRYLPVPTISRDRKVLPAISSTSTSTHEMYDFHHVAIAHRCGGNGRTTDDLPIELDHHGARIQFELGEQLLHRARCLDSACRAVDGQLHA